MKSPLFVSLILLFVLTGRADSVPAANAKEEAELRILGQAWIDAEVHHDRDALERILDERFLVTYASAKTLDRAGFIARILSTQMESFEVLHEEICVHGATAVVIDTTVDHRLKFVWIAIRREGRWRVIAETFSRAPEAK